jgi:hypothetical protein
MLVCFFSIAMLGTALPQVTPVAIDPDAGGGMPLVHVREPELEYKNHEFPIGDIRFPSFEIPGMPLFRISLDKGSFPSEANWNGKIKMLPIGYSEIRRRIVETVNRDGLLKASGEETWHLENVVLFSVCEEDGHYLWVARFALFPKNAGTSYVPVIALFFHLDGKFISPVCISGEEKEFEEYFGTR